MRERETHPSLVETSSGQEIGHGGATNLEPIPRMFFKVLYAIEESSIRAKPHRLHDVGHVDKGAHIDGDVVVKVLGRRILFEQGKAVEVAKRERFGISEAGEVRERRRGRASHPHSRRRGPPQTKSRIVGRPPSSDRKAPITHQVDDENSPVYALTMLLDLTTVGGLR